MGYLDEINPMQKSGKDASGRQIMPDSDYTVRSLISSQCRFNIFRDLN